MKCNHKILHQSECGYVVRCQHCQSFQVAFGTTLLHLSDEDYQFFCQIVATEMETAKAFKFEESKCVTLKTMCRSIALIYTYGEIKNLYHLLKQATVITQVYQYINKDETYN